ncbi:C-type natriuretic peptide prohormone [Acipenser oxyrinchus oxyrinchus]|uniref:C-type natriuretic peptide prohormone n=1 Tax=Acipenser oxyrinchus oxyrinchus TaxID=40147 RepID=A0AAD8CXQ2_ACIOX|nr:C-type natriuretic peptide prohormone [Acipenser oxyrinchus oxyrinchus]
MISNTALCFGILAMLSVQNLLLAKPVADIQTLSRWLEGGTDRYLESEVKDSDVDDLSLAAVSSDQLDRELLHRKFEGLSAGKPVSDEALVRILSDVINSAKRYGRKNKKGVSRGCFGVKLDRIGSMSGMGC